MARSSFLLYLARLPKKTLASPGIKNSIKKVISLAPTIQLIALAKVDETEYTRLAAYQADALLNERTFLTDEEYSNLKESCPEFKARLEEFSLYGIVLLLIFQCLVMIHLHCRRIFHTCVWILLKRLFQVARILKHMLC